MLIQRHRFHGRTSLRATYQRGKTLRSPTMSLRYARREPNKPYRVAVVVSKKVSKSAVVRNRIRRRIYEVVRTTETQPAPGTDLVFTVFADTLATQPAEQLRQTVQKLIHQTANQEPSTKN